MNLRRVRTVLEQLHEGRKQVVRLHRAGHGVMAIVALTGLSYPAVRKALDLDAAGGVAALKPRQRGRSTGEGRSLSPEQERAVPRTIYDSGLDFGMAAHLREAFVVREHERTHPEGDEAARPKSTHPIPGSPDSLPLSTCCSS